MADIDEAASLPLVISLGTCIFQVVDHPIRFCMHLWLVCAIVCESAVSTIFKTMPRISETDSPRHNNLRTNGPWNTTIFRYSTSFLKLSLACTFVIKYLIGDGCCCFPPKEGKRQITKFSYFPKKFILDWSFHTWPLQRKVEQSKDLFMNPAGLTPIQFLDLNNSIFKISKLIFCIKNYDICRRRMTLFLQTIIITLRLVIEWYL